MMDQAKPEQNPFTASASLRNVVGPGGFSLLRKQLLGIAALAVLLLLAQPIQAQQRTLESFCQRPEVGLVNARDACIATAQAAESSQPLLGILIAGGNPTIGSAGAAGLRLGILPRVSAGARLNIVPVRLPDILAEQISGQVGSLARRIGVPAPAVSADVSVGLFEGVQIAPGLGGIGGVSLLGSVSVLPFELFDSDGFDRAGVPYGLGGRLHLLGESFIAPGISLSVMRRSLPEVSFGDICPTGLVTLPTGEPGNEIGACAADGDAGEFAFDMTSWSTRLVASKRLLGLGASVGVGHDSHDSSLGFGFRSSQPIPGSQLTPAFRASDVDLENSRWTLFGNLSFSLLVASIAAEAGWVQGDAPITGFEDLQPDFDPRAGSWYGSLGGRISF